MTKTKEITVPVRAIGSTDAQQRAKTLARNDGHKAPKVVGIRTVDGDYNPKIAQDWIVRLEVRA